MSFLYPYVLTALILPLLMGALALLLHRQAGHGWRQLVSPAHEQELVHRRPVWRTVLPAALALLAFACAILAAARPINGYEASGATATGRNLMIALDISRSMETQDVAPSRLEEARAAAYELIDALPGDKIGLMVFSGEADLVVPLTYDHTALRDALEQINRGWAGAGGTNFGMVLRRAMADFSRSAPDGTNALVILSDGEDTVDSSLDIAREARRKNLLVITVGIGTEAGGAIPDPKGENGLWQDADGKHVISKLQVRSLRQFAEATGGDFFLMGSGTSLSDFARKAVDKLDRHEEVYSSAKVPRDLFAWFAGAALLLLAAAILIGTEWKAPRHTALFLLLLAAGGSPAQAAPENAYAQAYSEALQAKQEGKDADMIRTLLSQALLDEDKSLQAAAFLALGNLDTEATLGKLRSLYQAELSPSDEEGAGEEKASPTPEQLQGIVDDLKKNILPWQDALKADASFSPAHKNIARIEELIKKLEEEIERLKQQQNNQQQDNQQDNKDDQQQDGQQDNKDDQKQGDQQDNKDGQQQGDQQDNKDDQKQGDQQDNKDNQQQGDQQDNKDNQQQGDQQDNKDDQKQGDQQNNKDDQQQDNQQNNKDKQPPAAQQPKLTDKEKARQRAASILQMHVDEEKGSPIPHFNDETRPPEKDY